MGLLPLHGAIVARSYSVGKANTQTLVELTGGESSVRSCLIVARECRQKWSQGEYHLSQNYYITARYFRQLMSGAVM